MRHLVRSHVFCKKGFVHVVWYLGLVLEMFSFISAWLFSMVAASHCSCFFSMCWTWSRQRRRRGRRPHDVHVRCFQVHGTIHMMAAKSTTWSYLKRSWDSDLKFERASRSLAKTGSSWTPRTMKNHSVFEVFRCLGLSRSVLRL